MTRLALSRLLVLALVVASCGRRDEGQPTIDSHTPAVVDPDEVGQEVTAPTWWVMKQVVTTLVVVPVIGETQMQAQTASYMSMTWEIDGTHVVQDESYCWSDISEVAGMSTSLPEAFYDAAEGDLREVELSGISLGATYEARDHLSVYGATLEDPYTDPLPDDPDDPTVHDFDEDGKPGFTALLTGWLGDAEAYMAQRTRTTMIGTWVREDRIEGSVSQTLEQKILGASKWWASMDGFESVPENNPATNYFILQATDHRWSCEELALHAGEVF